MEEEEIKNSISKKDITNIGMIALGILGFTYLYGYLSGFDKGQKIKGVYLKGLIDGLNIGGKQ